MVVVSALLSLALMPAVEAPASQRHHTPFVHRAIVTLAFDDEAQGGARSGKEARGAGEADSAPPARRRGVPRVSRVRCAPAMCQTGCPVVKTQAKISASAEPPREAARIAKASAAPAGCAKASASADEAEGAR